MSRRPRRRVVRPSDAVDYDRTADRGEFISAFEADSPREDSDGARDVELDESDLTGTHAEEPTDHGSLSFWEEQRPPHY